MNNSGGNGGTIEISKAMIGCLGSIIGAIIAGVFLLISTGVINFSSPSTNIPTQTSAPQSDTVNLSVPTQASEPQANSVNLPLVSVQLPSDNCQNHLSGYCGLDTIVEWSNIDIGEGYYIYTIGHGLYYQPELWWIAGNGVPITKSSGQSIISDSAYGNSRDSLGIFACLTTQKYSFDEVSEITFLERPICNSYSSEITFQPK